MKIKTREYDTTAKWTLDSPLFLRDGMWTTNNGTFAGGCSVPGTIIRNPLPSVDNPYLQISWPEITVQTLIERSR